MNSIYVSLLSNPKEEISFWRKRAIDQSKYYQKRDEYLICFENQYVFIFSNLPPSPTY